MHCTLKALDRSKKNLESPCLIHLYTLDEARQFEASWYKHDPHAVGNAGFAKQLATREELVETIAVDLRNCTLDFPEVFAYKTRSTHSA